MRFATACTLAFAICGKANRDKGADVSKGTTEDLEHRFRQETNFEDHVPTNSSCPRVRRLAVILTLSSAVISADAFAPPNVQSFVVHPFQKDSNTAFAPILTNSSLDGTHEMLRPVNANRANPILANQQMYSNDIKLNAIRQGEETQALVLAGVTSVDVEAFSCLNKHKDCRPVSVDVNKVLFRWKKTPQFNVFEKYTGLMGKVAEERKLSPAEQSALWGYTNRDANIINQIARGADTVEFRDTLSYPSGKKTQVSCTLTKEDMLPWLRILNAGLNKMPSAAAGRLYRGVGRRAGGTAGSIAPITGFSSFSEDFNVAKCFADEKRTIGIQPTIFVMDEHSSGRQLEQMDDFWREHKEVVFRVGTKFVIEENQKVQREVEALWRENLVASTFYDGQQSVQRRASYDWLRAKPDFTVMVIKEVPSEEA